MSFARPGVSLVCVLGFLVVFFGGCAAPDRIEPPAYEDDFGTAIDYSDEITEDSVSQHSMLHRRAQFDLSVGPVFPLDSNFDPGVGAGGKFGIEVFKNLFMGANVSWSHHDAGGSGDLGGREAGELYDNFDRFNFMAQFDYDIPIGDVPSSVPGSMAVRLGLGAGLTLVTGEEDDSDFQSFELEEFYGFVLRPAAEFRYRVWEGGHLFASLSYDFVPQNRIDITFAGDRREVDDDIEFDSVNLGFGFAFEW